MFQKNSLASRIVLVLALTSMVAETAVAGITDISNVPLATAGGTTVLPNLLFDLDDSGSMNWDFMPDYVSPTTGGVALTQGVPCMYDPNKGSFFNPNNKTYCNPGDAPYIAGGSKGFNGVGYDPNFYYRAGIGPNGQPLINPPSGLPLNNPVSTTKVFDDVYSHSPYGSSTTTVNLASAIPDMKYCNSQSVCKRNGATDASPPVVVSGTDGLGRTMTAGQFPYRTHPTNSSTQIFGLPEMMSIGSFSRPSGSTTVTATTVEPHGLTTNDWIYVTGTGDSSVDISLVKVATVANANTFTYTGSSSSGSVSAKNGSYRKYVTLTSGSAFARVTGSGTSTCGAGTINNGGGDVCVTSTAHGLVTNDVITTASVSAGSMNMSNVAITVLDADHFKYNSGATNTTSVSSTGRWVRTGLYNRGSAVTGPALSYAIVPVEYCSDANLTNCVLVLPGNTPPGGFSFPAYVRFCQTQAEALAPVAVADSSGTPRCRAKYDEDNTPQYLYARYGWFRRDTIHSSVPTYANRPNRPDCAAAPTCTYDEELNNYARWYTYYRTRLQMMKTSVGLAFLSFIGNPSGTPPKPSSIRLGLITMHAQDSGSVSSTKYLKIANFDTAQAALFYDTFYKQTAGNGTPLQEALARAGWIYAGKLGSGLTKGISTADDPVQAACQRNFTLLTTDGYWNGLDNSPPLTPAGKTILNLDEQPQNLLGNILIDRDTTVTLDGTGNTSTKSTPIQLDQEQVVCQGNNTVTFSSGATTSCGCQPTEHAVIQRDFLTYTYQEFSNGVETTNTTKTNEKFSNVSGCVTANWTRQDTPQTTTEDVLCRDRNSGTVQTPAVFKDGSTKSCSSCSSNNYVVIRQTKTATRTVITADGVQTLNNTPSGTASYMYSTNGTTFSSSFPGSCSSSSIAISLSPNPQTSLGTATSTSGTGTAVAAWSPNPQTTMGGTATSTFSGAGTPSTVADVATYYYQTKLRGGTDVYGDPTGPQFSPNTTPAGTVDLSTNEVPVKTGAKDFIPYQHMVTFGIGLADGLMRFQTDYDTAANGDFFNIKSGTLNGCFWTSGSCNWPAPANNTSANLDDLWHAAVNGRGTYYQALNADALSRGIASALTALSSQVASAAASATSSPNVTQTDNQIFSTTYETNTWSGKVFAQTIDPSTGNVNPTVQWYADQQLVSKVGATSDTRTIYTFDSSVTSTSKIKSFDWASLTAGEQAYFNGKCSLMFQCGGLTLTDQTTANDGSQLLGYLRGWQALEGTIFRDRTFVDPITGATTSTVLGDTISAKPVYVRNPTLSYNDAVTPTYASFFSTNATRSPRVYVAANDGYLHAFHGDTGAEVWAYAPGFLLPGMYALADTNYSVQHRFFVDGSPESFDVYDASAAAWKTILIGGAGGGGRGFYALDITDASNPKALWEFCNDPSYCSITDADLGFAYGNPIVGKRKVDGKWVVVLTSGLNNAPVSGVGTGDGVGYFYVLDAITGAVLSKVSTGVGNTTTPAGLMKMSAFYDSPATDATFEFVYGGDQLGNVWRLDVGQSASPQCAPPAASTATAPCVTHVTTLKDAAGRAQPITTRPALTHIGTSRVLYIGTGRYLGDGTHGGLSDLTDPGAASGVAWQQTLYGFKDKNADYGASLRTGANLVTQTLTAINTVDLGITSNAVDWNTKDGWLVDFISAGERVNIDPRLVLGTLKLVTNIPAAGGAGAVGGSSRVYDFDFRTGSAVATATNGVVGSSLGGTIAVGMAIVQLPSGDIKDIITGADTSKTTVNVQLGSGSSTMRRFSYRER